MFICLHELLMRIYFFDMKGFSTPLFKLILIQGQGITYNIFFFGQLIRTIGDLSVGIENSDKSADY